MRIPLSKNTDKNCGILISGSHLAIDYYTNEEMKITGFLDTIQYEN